MKKRMIALLLLAALAAALCGCGQAENSSPAAAVTQAAQTEDPAAESSQADPYQQFLDGQLPVYVDTLANSNAVLCPDYEVLSGCLQPGTAYTLDELTAALAAAEADAYPDAGSFEPKSIDYALTDCGNDGAQELALRYTGMGPEELDINLILVIRQVDDKLQCVFACQYGYRTDASLNSMGLFVTGGSSGAANYGYTTYYIDKAGTVQYDYDEEVSLTAYAFYLPDNEVYQSVAEEQGISDSIGITRLSFAPYTEDESYSDYMSRCLFTFEPLDANYNALTGDERTAAFEESSPYMTFWASTGLAFSSQDEINAAIAAHEQQIGVTDEIKNAPEAAWTNFYTSEAENSSAGTSAVSAENQALIEDTLQAIYDVQPGSSGCSLRAMTAAGKLLDLAETLTDQADASELTRIAYEWKQDNEPIEGAFDEAYPEVREIAFAYLDNPDSYMGQLADCGYVFTHDTHTRGYLEYVTNYIEISRATGE